MVNTAIGASVIFVLTALGTHYALANAIGYAVGLLTSFLLNRNWTFKTRTRDTGQIARFAIVFAVAYSVNLAVVTGAIEVLGLDPLLSQIAGVAAYVMLSFIGMKFIVFVDHANKSSDTSH